MIRQEALASLAFYHHLLYDGDGGIVHPLFAAAEQAGSSWTKSFVFSSVEKP